MSELSNVLKLIPLFTSRLEELTEALVKATQTLAEAAAAIEQVKGLPDDLEDIIDDAVEEAPDATAPEKPSKSKLPANINWTMHDNKIRDWQKTHMNNGANQTIQAVRRMKKKLEGWRAEAVDLNNIQVRSRVDYRLRQLNKLLASQGGLK